MAPQGIGNSYTRHRGFVVWVTYWAALAVVTPIAVAVDPKPGPVPPGQNLAALVRVHLPLTGSADQTLQTTIRRSRDRLLHLAREQRDPRRPVLVLQLDSPPQGDEESVGSQFERAFGLARFLCSHEMAGIKTVAFVPHSLRGHGVLLALASEEIVMSSDAMIGEAGAHDPPHNAMRDTVVAAYREIAETQRTIPIALAVAMIDPSMEVIQVEAEDGTHFLSREALDEFAANHEIIKEQVLVPGGTLAQFDGREGRQFGFVKYLASSREGLAEALDVPLESLIQDEALAEAWRPVVIDISGELTPQAASRFETLLGVAVQQHGANWICVRIDSSGGDLEAGLRIASSLARLDANTVRTVAYVPAEATAAAAVIALACDQLAMHPTARLAAATPVRPQPGPMNRQRAAAAPDAERAAAVLSIRESLAPRTDHPWSLLAAMIDPSIDLASYSNRATGETRWLSPEEVATQPDAQNWQMIADVKERLLFDGQQAQQQGLAWRVVDTFDELKQHFGLEGDVPNPQPNMALEFVEALGTPELAMILLMVGFAGIYIELRTPGVGAGAFVGAVALLLFFWSKYLNGTAGWLEVLLFVAGFCFVLLEVFVLPGFGIFGLGGGALMLASLVLASLTFVRPHSEVELEELAHSVGTVALAGLGVVTFIVVTRRYLPQTPVFRHMVLQPPTEDDELTQRENIVNYSSLIGATGHAATDLRPAGRARINHELVDVIAEAEPLDSGTPLVVVEARGNRVVVRATS